MQQDWTTIGESKGGKHHLILSRNPTETRLRPASVFAKLRRDKSARQDAAANAFNAETPRTQRAAEFFFNHGWTRMDTDWEKGRTMLDTNFANDRQLNSRLAFVRVYPCPSVVKNFSVRNGDWNNQGMKIGQLRNELAIGMNSKQ